MHKNMINIFQHQTCSKNQNGNRDRNRQDEGQQKHRSELSGQQKQSKFNELMNNIKKQKRSRKE